MHIHQIGSRQRFVVVNDDGLFWSGPVPGWVPESRRARVFAERKKAEKALRVFTARSKALAEGKQYVAQVTVTTRSDRWRSIEDLRESLEQNLQIIIDSDLDIVDVAIDWTSLNEQVDGGT